MSTIVGIDHVQLVMPAGGEALARQFYGGVLGLPEIPKPPNLALRGGVWFQCGPLQLHLGVDQEFQPAKTAHPALLVDDLEHFLQALQRNGSAIKFDQQIPGYQRAFTSDPFGNRIELLQPLAPN
jgi:catechol 2,3-dioxygenase-like lactoylglutathione lyase family enzyme